MLALSVGPFAVVEVQPLLYRHLPPGWAGAGGALLALTCEGMILRIVFYLGGIAYKGFCLPSPSFFQLPSGVTNLNVVGLFCNCRLGYLLPRYDPMILGRRVRIGLTATHLKPICAQARTPLLRPWTGAYGGGSCYKKSYGRQV